MKIQLRLIMLTLLCAVAGTMWGATTYSHTFAQSDFTSTGSSPKYFNPLTQNVTLSGVDWNIVLTPKSGGNTLFMGTVDGTKGLQFGSGSNPASSIKLSTSGIPGTIKSVTVNTSGASSISGTVKVSVKSSSWGIKSLTATATDYTFSGSASGEILIEWSQTSSKAIYINYVEIEYEGGSTISVSAPTFSPTAGAVKAKTPVTITAAEGCTLSYTVNGVAQTSASNTATVSPTVPTTIKAKAVKDGVESEEVTAVYTISVAAPTFSPAAGAVEEGTEVTITSPDAVSMRFTVDDGEPSTITAGTIEHTVTKATTLKAVAIDAYGNESEEVVASYTIVPQGVKVATIDFENAASTYTDWTFTNIVSQKTNEYVTPHGGSYFGNTDKKETGSITTKEKVVTPISLTCYVSKESNNTTASTWYIQVSSDGNNWTNVSSISASSMERGEWKELTADLSEYENVFVRVYYDGTSAVRDIDDVQLVYVPGKKVPELSWSESTIVMNVGETRDFPTLICPEGVERDNATSSNHDVVTMDARDNGDGTWTLLLKALSEGTSVITVYTKENADYLAGEASFTVTVVDPTVSGTEATYVFNQGEENYGSGMRPDVGGNDIVENQSSTWKSEDVTMVADGRYKWHIPSNGSTPVDLRFYKKLDTTNSYPSMTFSVPSGYNIIKIEFTGSYLNNWTVDGAYVNNTWQGKAQSVVFENKSNQTIQVQTVTVTYTTPSTEEPIIWMTYSSANNLDFTGKTDYTAFIATSYRAEEGVVGLTKIEKVPGSEGILIKSNDSSKAIKDIFKESDVATEESITTQITQMLVGAPLGVEYLTPEDSEYTNFVLAKREGVVGFYKVAQQGALAPNKAYLQIPTASLTSTNGANGITFVEDGTTAIQSVTTATTDDAWYTLQGVRVAQPTRGLYIHNGKKVVVK